MVKKLSLFLTVFLLFGAAVSAKLNVVATLPVLGTFAEEVGGAHVEVTSLARANQDPHFLDAKPSFVVALNKADLLVSGGLDLERGWLPALLNQARNPKVNPGAPGHVNAAEGVRILEFPASTDRALGDVHPNGNPHTWLDPENAKLIAANIYKHLAAVDPEGESDFRANLDKFLSKLRSRSSRWKSAAAKLAGKKVVTYHKSFTYFASWTGLEIAGTIEPKPGIPPNPKHVDELLKLCEGGKIAAILVEDYYPHKVPDYLSSKTGVPVLILPNTTGGAVSSYEGLIDLLLGRIGQTL